MIRYKLKCGGHPRKKALLGADGAIMAAATLTAAAMNTAATASAAKNQANAIENSAKTQAAAIKAQTANNTQLQQENINFTRQQNKENRDQQQAIQTTLQMLAGQQNMNDRLDKSKVAVKYGGSKNAKAVNQHKLQNLSNHNRSLLNKTIKAYNKEDYEDVDYDLLVKAGLLPDDYATDAFLTNRIEARNGTQTPFYGGASAPFTVTDGGGVIPLNVDNNGYGLYEIYGNDHNHYHKTNSGKYKSGVGFKFNDGTVVEGEGNQNTNQGELFYVTPQDAMFISKHSINGFNPAKAVQQGMHPQEAFNIQQSIKTAKGISDDGNKTSYKRNTADNGWWHEFIEDTKDTGRDLIEALTTRKGIGRGIREFGQGIPFLNGALDSFADYVEGDNEQPIYGVDAEGNQHLIGYMPTNNNENALFSIIGGPAGNATKIIQQANKSKQAMSVMRAGMNKTQPIIPSSMGTTRSSLVTVHPINMPKGIPVNIPQTTSVPIDKRALVRYRQQLRDARYKQWLESFFEPSAPINKVAHAARNKALDIALQVQNAKQIIANTKRYVTNTKRIVNDASKQYVTNAKQWLSNDRNKYLTGMGVLGVPAAILTGKVLSDVVTTRSNNYMPVNANLPHPYVDSYQQAKSTQQTKTNTNVDTTRQKQQVKQQSNANAVQQKQQVVNRDTTSVKKDTTSIKQESKTNINASHSTTSQQQITTQQAKQDAKSNNTTKTYKNFNEAFDAAIARGDKTFIFGGLEYAAIKAKGDDSRNRRWGARRTEQIMSKYKDWNDYLNRTDKRKMKYGGRVKASNGSYWQNYGGATYNAIGNIVGAGVNVLGNYFAGNTLSKAYNNAGNILANAYDQMGGIDLSSISREDYAPGHAMAVVRSADTNVNPQLERLRRNATSEKREVNRNTLSSAARQQRLAGIDDRMYQRAGEVYASKLNEDEKIKQQNAANIQDVSEFNAKLDANANKEFANTRLSLMQYNNNINNAKIAGRAQSLADAATQSSAIRATAMQNSTSALGSALASIGQGFANAYEANRKQQTDFNNAMIGADTSSVITYLVRNAGNASSQDRKLAETYYNMFKDSTDSYQTSYAKMLANAYGFGAANTNTTDDYMFPELIGTSHPFYRYSVIRR
jgi:hypothetical protein